MQAGRAAAIWLIAGLSSLTFAGLAECAVGAAHEDGWDITFALDEPAGHTGSADAWQATLTLTLSGKTADREEIVAIVEGTLLTRMLVPLEPGREPGSRQTSLPIHAASSPREAIKYQATTGNPASLFHRIDIVFARLRGMKTAPFLKWSVYVTAGPRPERRIEPKPEGSAHGSVPEAAVQTEPIALPDQKPLPGIERPPVAPVQDGAVRETDLTPPAPKSGFQDYWQDVQQRITARFGQRTGSRGSVARTPRVGFRLYRDGVAQIIFLERSSGNSRVDRAGLDSVMEAHPFPAFPPTMGDAYVDVHVDFADAQTVPAMKRRGKG
jgi:hypothetical protein